jgi:hypothetical protein
MLRFEHQIVPGEDLPPAGFVSLPYLQVAHVLFINYIHRTLNKLADNVKELLAGAFSRRPVVPLVGSFFFFLAG